MKKLLCTTAIAGLAMTYATVSSAATTVSGNLGLSYYASSDDLPTTASRQSLDGFGKESQINISNSGDLNNGMKYAAGFSFEFDGGDSQSAGTQAQTAENVYIDFISGNTTITVGADHFQNTDAHLTNLVGFGYLGADGASQSAASIYPTHGSNYSAYGVGVKQASDIGSIGIWFTPNNTAALAANDIGNSLTKTQVNGSSATEVTFRGSLGVKGLDVLAGHAMQDKVNGDTKSNRNTTRIAAKYSVGAVTVAVDSVDKSSGTVETSGKSIGIAYSVSDKLSIGYTRAEADTTTASTVDEKMNMYAIGYNLGAVSIQAQLKDVDNLGGTSTQDGKIFGVYLGTKF
jgi:hypothetical protein